MDRRRICLFVLVPLFAFVAMGQDSCDTTTSGTDTTEESATTDGATTTEDTTEEETVTEEEEPVPEEEPPPEEETSDCAEGYDPCVPPYPPDVDCSDVRGPITVSGDDPHGLDRDGDGVGCE